jgi:hypothetical protein
MSQYETHMAGCQKDHLSRKNYFPGESIGRNFKWIALDKNNLQFCIPFFPESEPITKISPGFKKKSFTGCDPAVKSPSAANAYL